MADINAYLETCAYCGGKRQKCNAEGQCYECQEEVRSARFPLRIRGDIPRHSDFRFGFDRFEPPTFVL